MKHTNFHRHVIFLFYISADTDDESSTAPAECRTDNVTHSQSRTVIGCELQLSDASLKYLKTPRLRHDGSSTVSCFYAEKRAHSLTKMHRFFRYLMQNLLPVRHGSTSTYVEQ